MWGVPPVQNTYSISIKLPVNKYPKAISSNLWKERETSMAITGKSLTCCAAQCNAIVLSSEEKGAEVCLAWMELRSLVLRDRSQIQEATSQIRHLGKEERQETNQSSDFHGEWASQEGEVGRTTYEDTETSRVLISFPEVTWPGNATTCKIILRSSASLSRNWHIIIVCSYGVHCSLLVHMYVK